MVVIRTPDGATAEYYLRRTKDGGLRLELGCSSYDLSAMMENAGWQIVGVRSFAAKRLLLHAGLLTQSVSELPQRARWRTALPSPQRRPHNRHL